MNVLIDTRPDAADALEPEEYLLLEDMAQANLDYLFAQECTGDLEGEDL